MEEIETDEIEEGESKAAADKPAATAGEPKAETDNPAAAAQPAPQPVAADKPAATAGEPKAETDNPAAAAQPATQPVAADKPAAAADVQKTSAQVAQKTTSAENELFTSIYNEQKSEFSAKMEQLKSSMSEQEFHKFCLDIFPKCFSYSLDTGTDMAMFLLGTYGKLGVKLDENCLNNIEATSDLDVKIIKDLMPIVDTNQSAQVAFGEFVTKCFSKKLDGVKYYAEQCRSIGNNLDKITVNQRSYLAQYMDSLGRGITALGSKLYGMQEIFDHLIANNGVKAADVDNLKKQADDLLVECRKDHDDVRSVLRERTAKSIKSVYDTIHPQYEYDDDDRDKIEPECLKEFMVFYIGGYFGESADEIKELYRKCAKEFFEKGFWNELFTNDEDVIDGFARFLGHVDLKSKVRIHAMKDVCKFLDELCFSKCDADITLSVLEKLEATIDRRCSVDGTNGRYSSVETDDERKVSEELRSFCRDKREQIELAD
jgi:hypothetical protein